METTSEPQDASEALQTFVAILIAVVTAIGAIVAWRASVAADGAGDADLAGLRSTLNVSEVQALNAVNAYENLSAFTAYTRYNALGDEYFEALEAADEDMIYTLDTGRANAYDIATAMSINFRSEFINPDSTYDIERQLDEMWADAEKNRDLNPSAHFSEADTLRQQTNSLLMTIMVLGVALVFLTLFEFVDGRLQYVMIGIGFILALAGTIAAVMIETGVLR